MSTIAFRATLVREIEQAMKRVDEFAPKSHEEEFYTDGKLDAYAHVLMLVKDEDI